MRYSKQELERHQPAKGGGTSEKRSGSDRRSAEDRRDDAERRVGKVVQGNKVDLAFTETEPEQLYKPRSKEARRTTTSRRHSVRRDTEE